MLTIYLVGFFPSEFKTELGCFYLMKVSAVDDDHYSGHIDLPGDSQLLAFFPRALNNAPQKNKALEWWCLMGRIVNPLMRLMLF